MTYILISIAFIIIGLIGVWKNKLPKFRVGPGYAAEMKFYAIFYMLIILGIIFLLIEITQDS